MEPDFSNRKYEMLLARRNEMKNDDRIFTDKRPDI